MPVFSETLDHVTGIVFARDLLQVLDTDAVHKTVAELRGQRPTAFVPETKKVAELLREMQHEKQHMRMVIDEYGGVAGLVTIEDLLEAIVGWGVEDKHDEHEGEVDEPVAEADGRLFGAGELWRSRLRELFAEQLEGAEKAAEEGEGLEGGEVEEVAGQNGAGAGAGGPRVTLNLSPDYEATTIGRLVSEIAGHIPQAGEVVEEDGLRLEVLASTDRKVERVRVGLVEAQGE